MKNLGVLLIIAGGIWLIAAFNASTSIPTSYGDVSNIGLMADRQNNLMLSGLTILAGVILFGFGSNAEVTDKIDEKFPCPFCAEDIKLEAKICKHCGKDVPDSILESNLTLVSSQNNQQANSDEYVWCKSCNASNKSHYKNCFRCEEPMG